MKQEVFSHLSEYYKTTQKPNGALLYSQEIVKYFIPNIQTTRNWVTIRVVPFAFDHSIVFIHNNLNPWFYDYLQNYEKWKTKKTKSVCYAGRKGKFASCNVPLSTDHLQDMEHDDLLREMAKYRRVYAVGRTAIEAKILGCEVLPYDPRYPDPDVWRVVDTMDAVKMLQEGLNAIEKVKL